MVCKTIIAQVLKWQVNRNHIYKNTLETYLMARYSLLREREGDFQLKTFHPLWFFVDYVSIIIFLEAQSAKNPALHQTSADWTHQLMTSSRTNLHISLSLFWRIDLFFYQFFLRCQMYEIDTNSTKLVTVSD